MLAWRPPADGGLLVLDPGQRDGTVRVVLVLRDVRLGANHAVLVVDEAFQAHQGGRIAGMTGASPRHEAGTQPHASVRPPDDGVPGAEDPSSAACFRAAA